MNRFRQDHENRLRTGWLILFSLASYCAIKLGAKFLLRYAFSMMFTGWNINMQNIARAPAWTQFLYRWHGSFITISISVLLLLLYAGFKRLWQCAESSRPVNVKMLMRTTAISLAASAALFGMFLLFDSIRIDRFQFSTVPLIMLPIIGIVAWSEEAFCKSVLYLGLASRWKRPFAVITVVLLFFFDNNGYGGGAICCLNTLLFALLTVEVFECYGLGASIGLRVGWTFGVAQIFGYSSNSSALISLYSVSEEWLTGGVKGPMCGLAVTPILLICLLICSKHRIGNYVKFSTFH